MLRGLTVAQGASAHRICRRRRDCQVEVPVRQQRLRVQANRVIASDVAFTSLGCPLLPCRI